MTTPDFLLSKVEKRPGRNKVELEKGKEKRDVEEAIASLLHFTSLWKHHFIQLIIKNAASQIFTN